MFEVYAPKTYQLLLENISDETFIFLKDLQTHITEILNLTDLEQYKVKLINVHLKQIITDLILLQKHLYQINENKIIEKELGNLITSLKTTSDNLDIFELPALLKQLRALHEQTDHIIIGKTLLGLSFSGDDDDNDFLMSSTSTSDASLKPIDNHSTTLKIGIMPDNNLFNLNEVRFSGGGSVDPKIMLDRIQSDPRFTMLMTPVQMRELRGFSLEVQKTLHARILQLLLEEYIKIPSDSLFAEIRNWLPIVSNDLTRLLNDEPLSQFLKLKNSIIFCTSLKGIVQEECIFFSELHQHLEAYVAYWVSNSDYDPDNDPKWHTWKALCNQILSDSSLRKKTLLGQNTQNIHRIQVFIERDATREGMLAQVQALKIDNVQASAVSHLLITINLLTALKNLRERELNNQAQHLITLLTESTSAFHQMVNDYKELCVKYQNTNDVDEKLHLIRQITTKEIELEKQEKTLNNYEDQIHQNQLRTLYETFLLETAHLTHESELEPILNEHFRKIKNEYIQLEQTRITSKIRYLTEKLSRLLFRNLLNEYKIEISSLRNEGTTELKKLNKAAEDTKKIIIKISSSIESLKKTFNNLSNPENEPRLQKNLKDSHKEDERITEFNNMIKDIQKTLNLIPHHVVEYAEEQLQKQIWDVEYFEQAYAQFNSPEKLANFLFSLKKAVHFSIDLIAYNSNRPSSPSLSLNEEHAFVEKNNRILVIISLTQLAEPLIQQLKNEIQHLLAHSEHTEKAAILNIVLPHFISITQGFLIERESKKSIEKILALHKLLKDPKIRATKSKAIHEGLEKINNDLLSLEKAITDSTDLILKFKTILIATQILKQLNIQIIILNIDDEHISNLKQRMTELNSLIHMKTIHLPLSNQGQDSLDTLTQLCSKVKELLEEIKYEKKLLKQEELDLEERLRKIYSDKNHEKSPELMAEKLQCQMQLIAIYNIPGYIDIIFKETIENKIYHLEKLVEDIIASENEYKDFINHINLSIKAASDNEKPKLFARKASEKIKFKNKIQNLQKTLRARIKELEDAKNGHPFLNSTVIDIAVLNRFKSQYVEYLFEEAKTNFAISVADEKTSFDQNDAYLLYLSICHRTIFLTLNNAQLKQIIVDNPLRFYLLQDVILYIPTLHFDNLDQLFTMAKQRRTKTYQDSITDQVSGLTQVQNIFSNLSNAHFPIVPISPSSSQDGQHTTVIDFTYNNFFRLMDSLKITSTKKRPVVNQSKMQHTRRSSDSAVVYNVSEDCPRNVMRQVNTLTTSPTRERSALSKPQLKENKKKSAVTKRQRMGHIIRDQNLAPENILLTPKQVKFDTLNTFWGHRSDDAKLTTASKKIASEQKKVR